MDDAKTDERLLANFGMLCYWLMFIESNELRELLRREDTENEEEDDEMDANAIDAAESIESVIEANYLFKTPIGVHILYQDACTALRRAVGLSPSSAMFVEYYVQLLVLVGDIQPACDYLEAFFHMNPDDPHASRMVRCPARCAASPARLCTTANVVPLQLAGFLGCYYPDSVDAQVAVLSRHVGTCSLVLASLVDADNRCLFRQVAEERPFCSVSAGEDARAVQCWRGVLVRVDEDAGGGS
jgi:hypothetical protein